jgi:hypothetical protein
VFGQQEYKFGYKFDTTYFKKGGLELYVKQGDSYVRRYFNQPLIGTIDKRNKDTFDVHFWPPLKLQANNLVVDSTGIVHDSDYVVVVKNWKLDERKYKQLVMPYKHQQLTATNIPFRIKFRDSTTYEGEFLNANVTYLWVCGKTKIFESRFVKPRNYSWSFGPYTGLSEIENPENEKKEFGFNLGLNVIYATGKLNFVLAGGAEKGFTKGTRKLNPYIGFGFGFSLAETFLPEIESK